MEFGRALPRPPRSSARPEDGWDGVDQRDELGRIVGVGGGEPNGQGDAVAVDDQVVLGARLTAVDRIGAGSFAPLLARTLSESTLARDQSMAASSPSQFNSFVCSRSQTPAACQSRSRLQQVVPLPQPSALGSKRHGHPVRKTKMIPPRAARSETRGRPPLGLGGSAGNNGSIASQRSSWTRDEVFMVRHHATPPRF